MAVRWRPMSGGREHLDIVHVHIADFNPLPCHAIVEHSQIPGEDGILAGRNPIDRLIKAAKPCIAVGSKVHGTEAPIDAFCRRIGVEYRPNDMKPMEYVLLLLKGRAPNKPGIAGQKCRGVPLRPQLYHLFQASERLKCYGKYGLIRTIGEEQFPICVIAPAVNVSVTEH